MLFRLSPLTSACAVALGLTLLQGCDSSGQYQTPPSNGLSTGTTQYVGLLPPKDWVNTTGDGSGDTDSGTDGDGDTDGGTGGDDGSNDTPREQAIEILNYTASHSNLAQFAQALALGSFDTGSTYNCSGGGTARLQEQRSYNHAVPTWSFSNCVQSSTAGVDVTYNGQMSSSCDQSARTSNSGAISCEATFTQFQSEHGQHVEIYNGTYAMVAKNESLRTEASAFSTESNGDTWSSPSQTIASEQTELRGLSTRLEDQDAGFAITALGNNNYRQAANGCLTSGTVAITDANGGSDTSITAEVGGNMVLNEGDTSSTIACSELSPMPYTDPQFN